MSDKNTERKKTKQVNGTSKDVQVSLIPLPFYDLIATLLKPEEISVTKGSVLSTSEHKFFLTL